MLLGEVPTNRPVLKRLTRFNADGDQLAAPKKLVSMVTLMSLYWKALFVCLRWRVPAPNTACVLVWTRERAATIGSKGGWWQQVFRAFPISLRKGNASLSWCFYCDKKMLETMDECQGLPRCFFPTANIFTAHHNATPLSDKAII